MSLLLALLRAAWVGLSAWVIFTIQEARNPGGLGLIGTLWRMVGVLLHARLHWRILRIAQGPGARRLVESYLKVAYRHTLPYLSTAYTVKQRMALLQSHMSFVAKELGTAGFERLLDSPMTVWSQADSDGRLSIVLAGPCPHREGSLTLQFLKDDQVIYKMAFSVVDRALMDKAEHACGTPVLFVGSVQGVSGQQGAIKSAAARCRDVAPQDMLLAALMGLANQWHVRWISGVSLACSMSLPAMLRVGSTFSYSAFWESRWGVLSNGAHHLIALPHLDKPIELVKSNHRKRTLLKREFKKQVTATVAAAMRHAYRLPRFLPETAMV